ncbi:hypothetical protein SEA_NUEVOMUNDO_54 [Mycobacterium phage NuevoMundo]|uniref:Uncharacterized protein n=2 Tax=Bixzunavirus TaxID=680114 RepID=A0A2D1G754_9CAUD|nr:hypothetical protein KHO58_gp056 [Mycobacterium phage Bigswole]YP_010057692.1 hypothetical protein KHO61_gp052 [Mycobacterium phage Mangeria]ATN87731.1 hypothetical protein SEA_BIGSWOLE_56 [Mycobacterium phage Bigswole]AVJ48331.1 hypothetical protein SEA_NUEVOMUNDO_54 [Mycobacterium phage NuevoMundo]QHB47621.1 hypothetical protein SEA_MANGERIA_52 [Mycobacterium phage Mangeria]
MAKITESPLGIYLKLGDTTAEDVFYHDLGLAIPQKHVGKPKHDWVEVSRGHVFRPRIVTAPRGEDWVSVGGVEHTRADVTITTDELARQLRRVAYVLIDEADRQRKEKDHFAEQLAAKSREVIALQGGH